jgi:hypothetical protein
MSDTPETDAEVNELKSATTYNMVWAEFARKLERERDEAREKLKWQMHWVETLRRVGRKLRKERDEAREYADKLAEGLPEGMLPKDVEVLRSANLGLATELTTVTEQRDKLAEAVNAATVLIAAKGRHNTMLAYEGLRKALATTNQPNL